MRCKICQIKFTPTQFLQKCCSVEHSIEWLNLNKEKIKLAHTKETKLVEKIARAIKKEKIEATYTHKDYVQKLQPLINTIVRLIDKNQACISSGRFTGKVNAGHYFSTSEAPHLRFNLLNIYLQSEHDNTHLHSNHRGYRLGIISNFGQEHLDYIDSLFTINRNKLTIFDLKEAIITARVIIKELKNKDLVYSNKERIELRNKYNSVIFK